MFKRLKTLSVASDVAVVAQIEDQDAKPATSEGRKDFSGLPPSPLSMGGGVVLPLHPLLYSMYDLGRYVLYFPS